MRNLREFCIMWTYSGATFRIPRIHFPAFLNFVIPVRLQRPLLLLPLRPKCVQASLYSSNYFNEKFLGDGCVLKSSVYLKMIPYYQKNGHFLQSPTCCSYYSIDLNSKGWEELSPESLSPQLLHGRNVEINDDGDDYSEKERELKQRRQLWEVGPGTTSSFNFAPFANDSITIQKLVQLGVKIYKWERKQRIAEFILKLDYQKDIEPYIRFLVDNGVKLDRLGKQLTLNPDILKVNIENMKTRLDYLRSKKFKTEEIVEIINENPFWLSFSTMRIDRRLGFFQRTYKLSGEQVRELASKCPNLITFNLDRVKDMTFKIKDEMGFEAKEIVTILLAHPEIWTKTHPIQLWKRFDYLHNELKFSHGDLSKSPQLLKTGATKLRQRVGFLQKVGRAQFNPEKPNFVSVNNIIEGDDGQFAVQVAKHSVVEFNEYLKTL